MTAKFRSRIIASAFGVMCVGGVHQNLWAQTPQQPAAPQAAAKPVAASEAAPGYVIGADDVLSIVFWQDKEMSTETTVRPDGKITVPLLNEIPAAGFTPEQLRDQLTQAARRYVADASVSVVVKQINSRKVFITGEIQKPGPYSITAPTTVIQLIATAGGLRDYAQSKKILIMRNEDGRQVSLPFNYNDVVSRKNLQQNILLKPGDTVIVP
jgi:polysaccharide export outer membrane protein